MNTPTLSTVLFWFASCRIDNLKWTVFLSIINWREEVWNQYNFFFSSPQIDTISMKTIRYWSKKYPCNLYFGHYFSKCLENGGSNIRKGKLVFLGTISKKSQQNDINKPLNINVHHSFIYSLYLVISKLI
jgi:hypothetical protein